MSFVVQVGILVSERFGTDQDRIVSMTRFENEAERRCHCRKRRTELTRVAELQPVGTRRNFVRNELGLILSPVAPIRSTRVMPPFRFKTRTDGVKKDEEIVEPAQHVTEQEKVFP